VNASHGRLKKIPPLSGPLIQISTGAWSAIARNRCSWSRAAALGSATAARERRHRDAATNTPTATTPHSSGATIGPSA
jgi:hypothetical protein